MKKINLNKEAILTGSTFDLGFSFFFGVVAWSIFDFWLILQGVPLRQVQATAHSSNIFMSALAVAGLLLDFGGGFIAAIKSEYRHLTHSAIASIPALIVNGLLCFNPIDGTRYSSLVGLMLCFPAYI